MKTTSFFFALTLAALVAGAQDATWLPSSTIGAMSLDYKALRANPLLSKQLDRMAPGINTFGGASAELAKQISNDIDKMLAAFMIGAKADDSHGVAFVSGSFDTAVIAAALKADPSCKVAVKDGVTVFAVPSADAGGKSTVSYCTFPAKGLIVGSDNLDTLLMGLATMNKKSPALSSDSMVSRAIANAVVKKYPLLLVGDTSSMSRSGQILPMLGVDMPSMPSFFALTLKEKDAAHVLASLTGVFAGEAEAAQFASTLNVMKSVYTMQMAANPEAAPLAAFLAAMSLGSNGKNVTATASIDEALLHSLTSAFPTLSPALPAK